MCVFTRKVLIILYSSVKLICFCADGSGYVEDGREIFDDDMDEDAVSKGQSKWHYPIAYVFTCLVLHVLVLCNFIILHLLVE